MVKHSASVRLRPIAEADIRHVFDLQKDVDGAALAGVEGQFVPWEVFFPRFRGVIPTEGKDPTVFVVEHDGRFAGYIGVFKGQTEWRISYWLERAFWGQGIGKVALGMLLSRLPAEAQTAPLYAAVIEGNTASCRMLEHYGFRAYGERKFHSAAHGDERTQILYRRKPSKRK